MLESAQVTRPSASAPVLRKPRQKKRYYNDIALRLVKKLYGLKYLHYGFFKDLEPTFENLAKAQQLYVDLLLSHIPDDVRLVWDVGCGPGAIAKALVERGLQVSCIDVDPYMIEQSLKATQGRIQAWNGRYEKMTELPSSGTDLVMMPESCHYIGPDEGWQQSRRVVRPGGYVLIIDFFKIRELDKPYLSKSGHNFEKFVASARENGFELVKKIDITPETAPTMDLYQRFILEKVFPITEAVFEVVERSLPWLYKILSFFFKKKILFLKTKYEHQDARIFTHYKNYYVLLFRKTAI
jgi:ubiquinone/menaquinone biosynthesis C-methylase UbiE